MANVDRELTMRISLETVAFRHGMPPARTWVIRQGCESFGASKAAAFRQHGRAPEDHHRARKSSNNTSPFPAQNSPKIRRGTWTGDFGCGLFPGIFFLRTSSTLHTHRASGAPLVMMLPPGSGAATNLHVLGV